MTNLTKSLFNKAKRVKADTDKETLVKEYIKHREDINILNKDIKSLEKNKNKNKKRIIALKQQIKDIEIHLIEIEENFYDIDEGLWLGLAVDLEDLDRDIFLLYIPWEELHKHFVVFGTTGFGKSRLFAIILRQIIKFGWNIFLVDPKGGEEQEIAKWMYEFALKENRNDSVMRIMAAFPDISDKLNPLFGMADEEIGSLNVSLAASGAKIEDASEKYFNGQILRISMAILNSITFLEKVAYYNQRSELLEEVVKEAEKYMKFKEMSSLDIEYEDDNIILPDVVQVSLNDIVANKDNINYGISPFNRILISFKELAYFGQYEHLSELRELVKTYPIPDITNKKDLREIKEMQHNALNIIDPLINMGNEHYSKVGDTFSVVMSQLAFGSIGKIFTDVRINPLRFKLKKDSVIALLEPAPLKFEKVSEMMIKIFTRMFISIFGEVGATGRKMDRRVALLIDEAKPMIYPGIEELYNKARALGMTIGAFFQSKSDTKFKLGDVLSDIVEDNTATQIYMKQISASSQEEIAKSFGTIKVATNMNMGEIDTVEGRNVVSYEKRDILEPNHIDKLQKGEAYIRYGGKKYFVKFPYQPDPDDTIKIEMPELESENIFNELEKINNKINENIAKTMDLNF